MNGIIDQDRITHLQNNQPLSFGDALYLLRAGKKLRRKGWRDNCASWIRYSPADHSIAGSFPRLFRQYPDRLAAWRPEDEDLFQDDWFIVN